MGKADIYESDYLEKAEIFADLVNGTLYQGEQVVKPQELKEQDGELRSISGNRAKKVIRDKVRLWKGTALAVFAVENQTRTDYHMVLRAMLSESMAYDRQWKKLSAKWRKLWKEKRKKGGSPSPEEWMSGMKKGDKFIPVVTIVVYYGREKPWDGARTLYELLDVKGNEEKILPFISNYRLNVFDYHEYEDFGQFHSELRSVFEFLRYSGDKKALKEKLQKNKERYADLSSEAKALLAHLTNIKEIPDVTKEELERGDFDMCKAFEDMKKEGRAEEIVEMGCEFGLSENTILKKLQTKLNISVEEAREFFSMFQKQTIC